jgi:G3E family GTPase
VEQRFESGVANAMLDGILIETTGMADPGPIVKTFTMDEHITKFCKLDGILTVVDCKHFLTQLHRERPPGKVNEPEQQVGFADKLLLNKVDVCERSLIEETKAAIRGINAIVPVRECCIASKPDEIPIDELLAIDAFDVAKLITEQHSLEVVDLVKRDKRAEEGHGGGHVGHGDVHGDAHVGGHELDDSDTHESHGGGGHVEGHGSGHGVGHGRGHVHETRHDTEVKSMVLEMEGSALDHGKFMTWLRSIIKDNSVNLYRYKGVLALKPDPSRDKRISGKTLMYILQGVHDMPEVSFSGEWPEGKPTKTQVVIIGRSLDKQAYREEFAKCCS